MFRLRAVMAKKNRFEYDQKILTYPKQQTSGRTSIDRTANIDLIERLSFEFAV